MELPVVATVEIQGERVVVRAAPISLAAELFRAESAAAHADAALLVVERCCRLESGAPVDPDTLSADSALRLVRVAVGDEREAGSPDFTPTPSSPAAGG